MAAIRSPLADETAGHDAEVVRRCQTVLTMPGYFDPGTDERTTAGHIAEFVQALRQTPTWAMHRAFDDWVRTRTRRPSPGEIVSAAAEHLRPIGQEIARRKREAEDAKARERPPPTEDEKAAAAALCARLGFTPRRMEVLQAAPLARSMEEAEKMAARGGEEAFRYKPTPEQLEAARAGNEHVRLAREAYRRMQDAEAARQARIETGIEYDRQEGQQ